MGLPLRTKKFFRFCTKLLLWTAGGLVVLVAFLATLVYVFQDDIKKHLLEELNEHLASRIEVAQVDLSIWRRFPYTSLEFKDVKAYEAGALAREDSLLLRAERLYLQFNIWDVIYREYTVRRLEIQGGSLRLRTGKHGASNFEIWENDSLAGDSEGPVRFDMRAMVLYAVNLSFLDEVQGFQLDFYAQNGSLKGNITNGLWNLQSEMDGTLISLGNKKEPWFAERNLRWEMQLEFNPSETFFLLERAVLETPGLKLNLHGSLEQKGGNQLKLRFSTDKTDINEALALLPKPWNLLPEDYRSDGYFLATGELNGKLEGGKGLHWLIEFAVEEGELEHKTSGMRLEELSLKGSYEQLSGSDSKLEISRLEATLEGRKLEGTLLWKEGKQAHLDFRIQGSLDLAHWQGLIPVESSWDLDGLAEIDLEYHGPLRGGKFMLLEGNSTGKVILHKVNAQTKNGLGWMGLNGNLELDKQGFHTENLSGNLGSSRFELEAQLSNLPAFALGKDALLLVNGRLQVDQVLLDEWISVEKDTESGSVSGFQLPEFIQGQADVRIGSFRYRKFVAQNLRGKAWLKPGRLDVQDVFLNTCSGQIGLDGQLRGLPGGGHVLVCEARLEEIEVQQLFYGFENFGQTSLVHKHIEGKLNSKARYSGVLDAQLRPDLIETLAWSHVELKQGRLREFEPLKALSTFIKVEELNDVHFETLSNDIQVADEEVIIPSMSIRSSVLDLELSGRHGFDQQVDYRFNLLLKDLLASKYRILKQDRQSEFGDLEERRGGARIFLKMTGHMDHPIIQYDMESTVEKIKEDLKGEKKTMRTLLRDDFGVFKNDTSLVPKDELPKRPNPNKVRPNEEFEFDF